MSSSQVYTRQKLMPHMAHAQNLLRRCRNDNKTFFHLVFMYCQSWKRNGNRNKTTIPESVFACLAMLKRKQNDNSRGRLCLFCHVICESVQNFKSSCGTQKQKKKLVIVISAMSQHILSMCHVRQWFPKIWSILMYMHELEFLKSSVLSGPETDWRMCWYSRRHDSVPVSRRIYL